MKIRHMKASSGIGRNSGDVNININFNFNNGLISNQGISGGNARNRQARSLHKKRTEGKLVAQDSEGISSSRLDKIDD